MLNKLASLREKSEDGFTLIELLIVVVIIGILAAIAIPIFLNQQKAAIAGGVKSDVRNTVTNIATYLTKNPKATDLDTKVNDGTTTDGFDVVKSDSATEITVEGDWNGYTVLGTNTNAGSPASADVDEVVAKTGNGYAFDSATGQYSGAGVFGG